MSKKSTKKTTAVAKRGRQGKTKKKATPKGKVKKTTGGAKTARKKRKPKPSVSKRDTAMELAQAVRPKVAKPQACEPQTEPCAPHASDVFQAAAGIIATQAEKARALQAAAEVVEKQPRYPPKGQPESKAEVWMHECREEYVGYWNVAREEYRRLVDDIVARCGRGGVFLDSENLAGIFPCIFKCSDWAEPGPLLRFSDMVIGKIETAVAELLRAPMVGHEASELLHRLIPPPEAVAGSRRALDNVEASILRLLADPDLRVLMSVRDIGENNDGSHGKNICSNALRRLEGELAYVRRPRGSNKGYEATDEGRAVAIHLPADKPGTNQGQTRDGARTGRTAPALDSGCNANLELAVETANGAEGDNTKERPRAQANNGATLPSLDKIADEVERAARAIGRPATITDIATRAGRCWRATRDRLYCLHAHGRMSGGKTDGDWMATGAS